MNTMTPEAKTKFSAVIEKLRERFLTDFHNAAESLYRLSLPIEKAALNEENSAKRCRLEKWLDEQARSQSPKNKKELEKAKQRHYQSAVKLAAATFLNRIVVLRHMEALKIIEPKVVSGGWNSPGYREFGEFAQALLDDDSEGFFTLLEILFNEHAVEMPGLFGDVGVTGLFPVPPSALKAVIQDFEDERLETVWSDDTALGWVYQFWNDKDRLALDEKVKNQGKIENYEIAAKTQLFTDRYMVEWLLQNSLNMEWMAICEKNGWLCKAISDGTLKNLEERRKEWRKMRDSGEISPEAIMPIETEQENRWKYWTDRPLSKELVDAMPESIRDLKLIDPAVGSGHFLVIAFDFLSAFYEEEAEHRGEIWPKRRIAEGIVENNLHGVDIDPRAIQIAAAALVLKAKSFCADAAPERVNLVASNLGLASLPDDDPAIVDLKNEVNRATGIPFELTEKILRALEGADFLGSLLKIDESVEEAIGEYEMRGGLKKSSGKRPQVQLKMDESSAVEQQLISFDDVKISILEQIDSFLAKCTNGNDLGLRLRGEQLSAGVKFIRTLKNEKYHLAIANPPYHSTGKLANPQCFKRLYTLGNQDLFSVFLIRALQLTKKNCFASTVTLSNWMYISAYEKLRRFLLDNSKIEIIVDLGKGAFSSGSMLINASMNVFQNMHSERYTSVALRPCIAEETVADPKQIVRNEAGLMNGPKRYEFEPLEIRKIIEGQPIIYWWDEKFLEKYNSSEKLGDISPAKKGLVTSDNARFTRLAWEPQKSCIFISRTKKMDSTNYTWAPLISGASGREWLEPLKDLINWQNNGLCVKIFNEYKYKSYSRQIMNEKYYFHIGVAFTAIGTKFYARAHRFASVLEAAGSSVFNENIAATVCLLNSSLTKAILQAFNPTVNFKNTDVNRLPVFQIESSKEIFSCLEIAFEENESVKETSLEFKKPGPSPWKYAQKWAQMAVDRKSGAPLPEYEPVYEDPSPESFISYSMGIALGRFRIDGEGIITEATDSDLPSGLFYLSAYSENDGLRQLPCQHLEKSWEKYGNAVAKNRALKNWLMEVFFSKVHLGMYEKRPIYFPLSSKKKNFMAYVSIHRWSDNTLQNLLADYLIPEFNRLDGELADLMGTRKQGDKKAQADAEKRYVKIKAFYDDMKEFIETVRQCAEQGPPPAKQSDVSRETDARFKMDLDDGVMINSAALWPLLEPHWKQPKTWWSELCNAEGRKDYDWSHMAARYFPKRVDEKCKKDPSLAVAHGCFWKYHPQKAYQWELRLQDEIEPGFTLDEKDSDASKEAFETDYPDVVEDLKKAEARRRAKKYGSEAESEYYQMFPEGEDG